MRIELDHHHAELVQAAVDQGRAADAQSLVHRLIDSLIPPSWVQEQQPEIETLLRERLQQEAHPRPADWREQIHEAAMRKLRDEG